MSSPRKDGAQSQAQPLPPTALRGNSGADTDAKAERFQVPPPDFLRCPRSLVRCGRDDAHTNWPDSRRSSGQNGAASGHGMGLSQDRSDGFPPSSLRSARAPPLQHYVGRPHRARVVRRMATSIARHRRHVRAWFVGPRPSRPVPTIQDRRTGLEIIEGGEPRRHRDTPGLRVGGSAPHGGICAARATTPDARRGEACSAGRVITARTFGADSSRSSSGAIPKAHSRAVGMLSRPPLRLFGRDLRQAR